MEIIIVVGAVIMLMKIVIGIYVMEDLMVHGVIAVVGAHSKQIMDIVRKTLTPLPHALK